MWMLVFGVAVDVDVVGCVYMDGYDWVPVGVGVHAGVICVDDSVVYVDGYVDGYIDGDIDDGGKCAAGVDGYGDASTYGAYGAVVGVDANVYCYANVGVVVMWH